MVVDRDTAGALLFVEELAEQGQDLGQLVSDLLEHLRHLLLVQHMGHVPESLPVTEETKELLRQQANQLPEPTVLRLIDLLAVAIDDMRQGADPRLPLELALVKVTRPHADLSRESLAHRVELLEVARAPSVAAARRAPSPSRRPSRRRRAEPPPRARRATLRTSSSSRSPRHGTGASSTPFASARSPSRASSPRRRPTELADDTLTLEFPAGADFHRRQVAEPQNIGLLRDALYEVTGRKLTVVLESGEAEDAEEDADDEPAGEDASSQP